MKKVIIGIGSFAKKALDYYSREGILCFVDINQEIDMDASIAGIKIIGFSELFKQNRTVEIIITIKRMVNEIAEQLIIAGFSNYKIFPLLYDLEIKNLLQIIKEYFCEKIFISTKRQGVNLLKELIENELIIKGIEVVVSINDAELIVIADDKFHVSLFEELKQKYYTTKILVDIFEFKFFFKKTELIIIGYNPFSSITSWECKNTLFSFAKFKKESVDDFFEVAKKSPPLFKFLEIETVNRCNGTCNFCPVNKNIDPRKLVFMKESLFNKIIRQLSEIEYNGHLCLFSNNEPLLDSRVVQFYKHARKMLPNATLYMFTNGTLLSIKIFKELIKSLDELVINNYSCELSECCCNIVEYVNDQRSLKNKVSIIMRNANEILSTRGGLSPNKKIKKSIDAKCTLPFQQMIVRPDGKISLCCNDALGEYTLGDLNSDTILDVWFGDAYTNIRNKLYYGRKMLKKCMYCDALELY